MRLLREQEKTLNGRQASLGLMAPPSYNAAVYERLDARYRASVASSGSEDRLWF
jgi:hypothetical protein